MADVQIPTWTMGDRLAKARKAAGVKQVDMADFLGVSHGSISAWENDDTPVKLGMLRGWALRCSVPLEWLRHGDAWTPSGDEGVVSDESWSACTRWPANNQPPLPFGETIVAPDRVVLPFRRAS